MLVGKYRAHFGDVEEERNDLALYRPHGPQYRGQCGGPAGESSHVCSDYGEEQR